MKLNGKIILAIFSATVWISISEFVRNEILFKSFWIKHYQDLGLVFPADTVNGLVWGIWSLLLAIAIFIFSKRFNLIQTTFLSWYLAFIMMWLVIGNLGVLPYGLLLYAVPLSLLEVFVATWIIKKIQG